MNGIDNRTGQLVQVDIDRKKRRANRAFKEMTPPQRRAWVVRVLYSMGLSTDDVAEVMRCSLVTVRRDRKRTKDDLADILDDEEAA